MSNSAILNEIVNEQEKIVFKGMRADMSAGKAILQPEQYGTFMRYATLPQVMLSQADFKYMKSYKFQLTKVGLVGRVLESGYKNGNDDPDTRETNPDISPAEVEWTPEELDAKKLKAMCEITDDEKEDNLEQETFEQTLLQMMGERIGEDLEYWAIFADTDISYSENKLLSTTDGWIKQAGVNLKSTGFDSGEDFDLDNTVEAMFDAMIYNMPPRARQNRNNLRFYVPFEVEDAYRNLLKSRGTPLGDSTQTGYAPTLTYKNIPIIHVPTLDDEEGRALDDSATSFLGDPKNMAYGIYKNLSIEPKRIVEDELTQYWYRMRGDVGYYYPEYMVTAKIDKTEVEELPLEHKV